MTLFVAFTVFLVGVTGLVMLYYDFDDLDHR